MIRAMAQSQTPTQITVLERDIKRLERDDIELQGRDLVLISPNGNRFALRVSNSGILSAEAL